MSLVTISGGVWIPEQVEVAGSPSFAATTGMTAGTHKIAVAIFEVPTTGSITAVGFRTGTVTTSDSVDIGIYTVDTSGNPTATAYGSMAVGTQASIASNTSYTITLGTACSGATVGDVVAIVLTFTSFVAGSFTAMTMGGSADARSAFPYVNYYNGAAWTKARAWPNAWVEYSGVVYYYLPHVFPVTTITGQSYASNTGVADEYALSFQVPVPARVAGASVAVSGSGVFELILYSGTTALQTATVNASQSGGNTGYMFVKFPTPQTITASTLYRLACRPTTTTSITLQLFTVVKAQAMDQMGGGQNFMLGKRLDQGAWAADVTTQRPLISVLFDQMDDGTGGGGGLTACPLGGFVR